MNPFSTLKSRYLVFGTYLIASVAIGRGYGFLDLYQLLPWPLEDPISSPVLSIAVWIAVIAVFVLASKEYGLRLSYVFGRHEPAFSKLYGLVLLLSLLLFSMGAFSLFFSGVALFLPAQAERILATSLPIESVNSQYPQLYQALELSFVIFWGPFSEELIFRGVLLQRWATRWGLRWGVVLSAIAFGLLHRDNPIGLTLFGLVMGLLYVSTRSLWVPIVCHSLNNLAVLGLDWLSTRVTDVPEEALTVAAVQARWWEGVILIAVSMPFIWRFVRQHWPPAQGKIPYVLNAHSLENPLTER